MRLLSTLLATAVAAAMSLYAQLPVGSWKIYPSFTGESARVVETPSKVYYTGGGSLFSFNKETEESIGHTRDTGLSDYKVTGIYPSPGGDVLAVCYSNGNIDILGEDGSIVNLSDIKDASVSGSKAINDIAFSGKDMYVATDFGLVQFDTKARKVISSFISGVPVNAVGICGSHVYISTGGELKSIATGSDLKKADAWTAAGVTDTVFVELADNGSGALLARTEGNEVRQLEVSDGKVTGSRHFGYCTMPFIYGGDKVYVSNGYGVFSADGAYTAYPESIRDNVVGGIDPSSSLWAINSDGITSMARSGNNWTTVMERFRPYSFSVREAAFIIPDRSGEKLYFTNLGPTVYRLIDGTTENGVHTPQATTVLNADGTLSDVAAKNVSPGSVAGVFLPAQKKLAGATTRLVQDCDDKSTYFIGTGNDGLYKVTEGEFAGRYDSSNSPMSTPWGSRVFEVAIDRGGNLWVGGNGPDATHSVIILPAAKRALPPAQVKADDWIVPDLDGFESMADMRIYPCRKSDMVFIFSGKYNGGLVCINTNGTPDNFNDDKAVFHPNFMDTDTKTFNPARISAIAEDNDGRVWIGTSEGVMEIANAATAATNELRVRRLKVDHNDGTGLADYLAGTDLVLDIAVDGANRKWIATEASGAYLVNAAGTEIVKHLNEGNSPLPSPKVNAVCATATGNSVYFATPEGVMEYGSDAAPAADSYSSIRVYPNPVTPDYGGDVTIDGLTSGSLVKIADAAGAVLWQGRAEGGMATWNVTNSAGRRVKTGIYYIFASPTGGAGGKGAVAKIMVVN